MFFSSLSESSKVHNFPVTFTQNIQIFQFSFGFFYVKSLIILRLLVWQYFKVSGTLSQKIWDMFCGEKPPQNQSFDPAQGFLRPIFWWFGAGFVKSTQKAEIPTFLPFLQNYGLNG